MVFFIFVSFKVCNSRLHCQCDAGYVPPDCLETASSPGGSIDDGFWNIEEEMEKCVWKYVPLPESLLYPYSPTVYVAIEHWTCGECN